MRTTPQMVESYVVCRLETSRLLRFPRPQDVYKRQAVSSEMQDDTSVIYLGDLWRGFLKYWWLCAAMAILLGGIMFYRNYIRFTPVYMSSATFTVRTQTAGAGSGLSTYSFYYDQATAAQLSSTFPYILQSNLLQEIVSSDLGPVSYTHLWNLDNRQYFFLRFLS